MPNPVSRELCPDCAARGEDYLHDNLVIYDDGGTWCFNCNKGQINPDSAEDRPKTKKKIRPICSEFSIQELRNWKISKKTCQLANYGVAELSGRKIHLANYMSRYNEIVAQKTRDKDKRMSVLGDASEMTLYLQWLWNPNDKIGVVICEGEKDALTILECMGRNYPVVSVPNGAAGAKKAIQKHLEWLLGFKTVVLAFDSDNAGMQAAEEVSHLFEPNKVRMVRWAHKDAHDVYIADGAEAVKNAIFRAPAIKPKGIVGWEDVKQEVLKKPGVGITWPWKTMTNWTYGIRPGELITIMAAPGIGKTNFISEVILHMAYKEKVRCGVMSFEQPPYKTYQRLIGKVLNKPIHKPGEDWDEEEVLRVGEELSDYIYCYDQTGPVDFGDIRNRLQYYARGSDCRAVVIDNLSNIAGKFDSDERRGIDKAMLELASWAIELKITIFLVVHVTKAPKDQKQYDEGRVLSLSDARGSSSIEQSSTYVLGLERNAKSECEEERRVMTVRCLKDREFDSRGNYMKMCYNTHIGKLEEL